MRRRSASRERRGSGSSRSGLNCAVCHTGTYARRPPAQPHVMLGMPAHQLDLQAYFKFLIACVLTRGSRPTTCIGAIASE